jgi:hypothetical protein
LTNLNGGRSYTNQDQERDQATADTYYGQAFSAYLS